MELQFGLDWRTAGIEHAREVRDLLGGDYYVDYADDNFEEGKVVRLGDIIAYHNETTRIGLVDLHNLTTLLTK